MPGKTEEGPAKYPDIFLSVSFFLFFWSHRVRIGQLTTYCLVNFFGPVKNSSLQDLLSSNILSLLGKTV